MFRPITLVLALGLYASLCQAELVGLDDAELSNTAAQGSITISIDAGVGAASSEVTFEAADASADGSVFSFTGIQTQSRDTGTGALTNDYAPINVVIDITDDGGTGDPAIVAAVNFNDSGVGTASTALKIGGWKIAPNEAGLGAAPSMGELHFTDVSGSAIIKIGLR